MTDGYSFSLFEMDLRKTVNTYKFLRRFLAIVQTEGLTVFSRGGYTTQYLFPKGNFGELFLCLGGRERISE